MNAGGVSREGKEVDEYLLESTILSPLVIAVEVEQGVHNLRKNLKNVLMI